MELSMDGNFILEMSIALGTFVFLIDVAVFVWVAFFKLEQLEDALGNSKLNIDAKRFGSDSGLLGRQYRLSTTISALLFTNMYVRKGLVDLNDVKRMPTHLKRWVLIPFVTGGVLFLFVLVLMFVAGKI
jgi:hypothetical protein